MLNKRRVEVFSAGCALCHEVIDAVRREAGSTFEIIVLDMLDARVLARAEKFGIRSVPTVVIDGRFGKKCPRYPLSKMSSKAARLARRRVLDAIGAPVWGTAP